jgi:hypothetical protein
VFFLRLLRLFAAIHSEKSGTPSANSSPRKAKEPRKAVTLRGSGDAIQRGKERPLVLWRRPLGAASVAQVVKGLAAAVLDLDADGLPLTGAGGGGGLAEKDGSAEERNEEEEIRDHDEGLGWRVMVE